MNTNTTCKNCGKPLRGRADKKFCDDSCRNNYNNQLKSSDQKIVRNINNILAKNRRILEQLIPENEEVKKSIRQKLTDAGFNFQYFTHQYKNQKGQLYCFVYDYGYLPLENDWFLIVHRQQ